MPGDSPRSYVNPLLARDFPDPFVLRFRGRYYAYGTGPALDGRYFRLASSRNLVDWEEHGGAIQPLNMEGAEAYWAPEVAYSEGRFYMYYAVGRDETPDHHLRLAVADHPLGPWEDAGINLTPEEIFAIDAHPFRDPAAGQWYLFYARDELEPPYAGTGIVVDRLLAMDRLEGKPRPVLRPYAEWQLFELQREVKWGLDWYTIEGPFVMPVGNRYLCFYSGGRWENPSYGVGYALADHPLGPWKDDANAAGPQVLTTVPGKVLGPGHNSIIIGPDLRTQYLVYHGWDPECTARYPRLDTLSWDEDRPVCSGPSSEPRPAPPMPDVAAWFDGAEPGPEWEARAGTWHRDPDGLRAGGLEARLALREAQPDFVAETSVRFGGGLSIGGVPVIVEPEDLRAGDHTAALPEGFRVDAWHTLSVVRKGDWISVTLDEYPTLETRCAEGFLPVELCGEAGSQFSHFVLSRLP